MCTSLVGSGLLALASAFKASGWIAGIVGVVIFWLVNARTILLIIKCKNTIQRQYEQNSANMAYGEFEDADDDTTSTSSLEQPLIQQTRKVSSYLDVAEFGFGKFGRYFLQVCMMFSQVGFCCAYLIFISTNITNHFWVGENKWIVMACVCPFLIALCWLPSMKYLAPSSGFANCTLLFSLTIILAAPKLGNVSASFGDIADVKGLGSLPVFFGIVAFAYTCHGIVIPFESQMKQPEKFSNVLWCATSLVTTIYVVVGTCGYAYFGEATEGDITVNLSQAGINPTLVNVLKIALMLGISCTYPLQMFPVIEMVEVAVLKARSPKFLKYLIRACIVLFTGIIANVIPFYGLFSSLVGAFTTSLMTIAFPVLLHLKICWPSLSRPVIALDVCILLFSAFTIGIGTELAITDIVKCLGVPSGGKLPDFCV